MAEKVRTVPGARGRGPKPKLEHPMQTLGRVLGFVGKKYWLHLIVVVIAIVVSVLSMVQGTLFTKTLIDSYILPLVKTVQAGGTADFSGLIHAITRVALFYACGVLASLLQARVMIYVTQGALRDLRNEMFQHMQTLPIRYFDTHAHGDIMSIYTNDIDTLRQMISQSMPQLLNCTITVVSVLVSMIVLSIPLTLLTLAMVAVVLFTTKKFSGLSGRYFVAQQKNLGSLNGFIKEGADGTLVETQERTNVWAWKRPGQDGQAPTYVRVEGDVTFDDVDFGYTDEKMVLHNIKLYATPGQKIAFVGSTGAGKTTITNLINRFYDIQDGKIRYDGVNINRIKKADLRRSLGIVLQDTNLFTGTVMDNIRYGRLDARDEECIAAAKLANADGFIRRLPEGYNTWITGNGANLSQGQRQLLAIARAAVADPPVLILDEATSSIDTRTEMLVQQGMDGLMYGRTTFVIAHRLSTVRNADCIMVLEQGRIIERGSHDELMEKKGRYYQLYTGNPPA